MEQAKWIAAPENLGCCPSFRKQIGIGKKVGKREDIYYATNGEICAYVEAYRALQTSSDGTILCNPTCTDIFLNFFGQKVRVNAGCTVKF